MLQHVSIRCAAFDPAIEHPEILGERCGFGLAAAQGHEIGRKRSDVAAQQLGRITHRIERDEDHLHLTGQFGRQSVKHVGQPREFGRTDVRAMSEAEKYQHHPSLEVAG